MNRNLFFCLLASYALMILCYSLNSGLTCTNDGSHFALVNSIVERGSFELDDNIRFAKHDSAYYSGKYYSDRPPGLSFLLCTFKTVMIPVRGMLKMINFDDFAFLKTDFSEDLLISMLQLAPAFCCAAIFLVLYYLLVGMSYKPHVSFLVAMSFCIGTILLRYGTLLYSHIFTSLLVVSSYSLAVMYSRNRKLPLLCISTFLIAYAVITEYMAVLLLVPLFLYYILKCRKDFLTVSHILGFLISGLIPAFVLMGYNYVNFGNPFSIAQFHHSSYVFYHTPGSIFFGSSFFMNAKTLMIHSANHATLFGNSLFICLILLLPLLMYSQKKRPDAEMLLFLSGFMIVALGISSYTMSTGGIDLNYRHMLFGVPLLAPLLAETFSSLQKFCEGRKWGSVYTLYVVVFAGLLLYSFVLHVTHVGTSYQAQRESIFFNIDAAFCNCSWFIVLIILYAIISMAILVRISRKGLQMDSNLKSLLGSLCMLLAVATAILLIQTAITGRNNSSYPTYEEVRKWNSAVSRGDMNAAISSAGVLLKKSRCFQGHIDTDYIKLAQDVHLNPEYFRSGPDALDYLLWESSFFIKNLLEFQFGMTHPSAEELLKLLRKEVKIRPSASGDIRKQIPVPAEVWRRGYGNIQEVTRLFSEMALQEDYEVQGIMIINEKGEAIHILCELRKNGRIDTVDIRFDKIWKGKAYEEVLKDRNSRVNLWPAEIESCSSRFMYAIPAEPQDYRNTNQYLRKFSVSMDFKCNFRLGDDPRERIENYLRYFPVDVDASRFTYWRYPLRVMASQVKQ